MKINILENLKIIITMQKENNSIILEDDFSLENLNLFLKTSTIISAIYNSE